MKTNLPMTPLQRIVGFDVAEETYDGLPFLTQIILDLKIEGYNDSDIARVLGMPRVTVIDTFRRARSFLANSKMKLVLETRVYYRETHASVMDNGAEFEGYSSLTSSFNNGNLPSRDEN